MGATSANGRVAVLPIPRTSRPSRATRSAWGPHANGPGSVVSNRHVRPVPSGATAQALPDATNATVASAGGTDCWQPSGSEATNAAPSADDEGEALMIAEGVALRDGDSTKRGEPLLQPTATSATATMNVAGRREPGTGPIPLLPSPPAWYSRRSMRTGPGSLDTGWSDPQPDAVSPGRAGMWRSNQATVRATQSMVAGSFRTPCPSPG